MCEIDIDPSTIGVCMCYFPPHHFLFFYITYLANSQPHKQQDLMVMRCLHWWFCRRCQWFSRHSLRCLLLFLDNLGSDLVRGHISYYDPVWWLKSAGMAFLKYPFCGKFDYLIGRKGLRGKLKRVLLWKLSLREENLASTGSVFWEITKTLYFIRLLTDFNCFDFEHHFNYLVLL